MASKTVRGSICKINFSSLMFFGVTRSVWVYSTVERSLLACWQTDKVLFLFSNVKTEKLQRGLVNSKIINSISLPKLQEFCNENAATWRPSLLQSRYSYIIKRLVKRLNQPMTATQIRIARSLKISHRNWTDFCKGRHFVSVHMQEWFYWSNAVTWCVTWNIAKVAKKERTYNRGLCREENRTICLHSNVIRIGEEHTTKDPKRKMWQKPVKTNKRTSRGRSPSLGAWQR